VPVRYCGFSIGFSFSSSTHVHDKRGTEFVIAAIPLGGYVKMLDEREAPVDEAELGQKAFNRKDVKQRIAIRCCRRPISNFLLAIVCLRALVACLSAFNHAGSRAWAGGGGQHFASASGAGL